MNKLIIVFCALLLASCSVGPANRDAPAIYDFGVSRAQPSGLPPIRASVLVNNVAAPGWLDTVGIVYRLNFQDAARLQTYAYSRWAAAPALLLTQRLRSQLTAASEGRITAYSDGARADYALSVELDEFSHTFDSAEASRAVVVARASLVNIVRRSILAQKSFSVERAAVTANAEGGVRALAGAGDELIDAVVAWVTASTAQGNK